MAPTPVRVAVVSLLSMLSTAGVYGFGYLLYFGIADAYIDSPYRISAVALVGLQVAFYGIFVGGLAVATGAALILARRTGAPPAVTAATVMFVLGVLAVPFFGFLSILNGCTLGHSFPFPGTGCS